MKILPIVFLTFVATLFLLWWSNDFGLPIFCTTRGCVTTQQWKKEKEYQTAFATSAHTSAPTEPAVLTTLVRRHLLINTQDISRVANEAVKYRTDILHLTQEDQLKQLGFTSFTEYDNAVTIPFLLQQSYMNEHSFQDSEAAYSNLAKDFRVVSLLFGYTWDSSKGEVVAR